MAAAETLYHIRPGESPNTYISVAVAAMQQEPFDTLLILPTSRLVHTTRRQLEDTGISFIESSILTLSGYASHVVEKRSGDVTRIGNLEKELIIATLLAEKRYPILDPGQSGGAAIARELRVLFDVLQERKIDYPAALGEAESRKSNEIGLLYSAYTRYLAEERLLDTQTAIIRAADWIRSKKGPKNVFIYGLYEPFPIERDLILALKETAEQFVYAVPYMPDSRCFADDGSWLGIVPEQDLSNQIPPLARYFDEKPLSTGGITITANRYRTPEEELRGIAGHIRNRIEEGSAPGDIMVLFPAIADSIALVKEIFPDFGIPVSTSTGKPLIRSQLAGALLKVLETPAFGFRREDLIALLMSPYTPCHTRQQNISQRLQGSAADILSRKAGVSAGAADWQHRIAAYIHSKETEYAGFSGSRAKHGEAEIRSMRELHAGILSLIEELQRLPDIETLSGHLAAYRDMLERFAFPVFSSTEDDELAIEEEAAFLAFIGVLDRLATAATCIPEKKIPAGSFLSLLTNAVSATRLPTIQNRNAVQVLGIREARHLRTPHLFIGNLTDGALPRLETRLPLCTNLETRMLQTLSGKELLREERYYFLAAIGTATERITLSYPESDGEGVHLRSGFMDGLLEEEDAGRFSHHSRRGRTEHAGKLLSRNEIMPASQLLPSQLNPASVARRINMETYHRRGRAASSYDGIIGDDPAITAALIRRFGSDAVYSVSALERYAACPFSFFAGNVLGIEALPEAEPDLGSLERGNLIHRILYRFFRERTKSNTPHISEENLDAALQEMRAIAGEEIGSYGRRNPIWIVESEKLLGSVEIGPGFLAAFLEYELNLAKSPFVPSHFECSFGLPLLHGDDSVSIPDPITIPLDDASGSIRLRGRIDRIDRTPDGRFCAIDYKTGKTPGYGDITSGKKLQLPLYIRAVELWMGLSGAGGAYYAMKQGEIQCRAVIRDPSADELFAPFVRVRGGASRPLADVIADTLANVGNYLEGIRSGQFPIVSDPGACPAYCQFKSICRFDERRLYEGDEP
ncbi:MAG: PD-(D/E)XK nuclease family protein [Methanocalculus sp. MSAO_Arc1]|uniref:PD-(D/E)XK nuclease family protein n=1 Tax=Methanocalculus TaxID=71151 RepID=UPI000FF4B75D|nr:MULTISPECIES: PD-(D/E)XK nuclease family protein [unclassified Methanocalculus]MCP1662277.1 ATP-dependent helicase/DNAse subunit B [Methanocalculus sp. AMF5]RQD81725.1 MAG: PD-(D/E)XK nuclease family protein [Methanocalculus sp. MSAO_Arc1]